MYATTSVTMRHIIKRLRAEGITARGQPFSERMMSSLLRTEAFVGKFVWGRVDHRKLRVRSPGELGYMKSTGSIRPIVDPLTWNQVQQKRARCKAPVRSREQLLRELTAALNKK